MDPREVIACPATVTVMWPRARLHNLRGEVIPTQFRSILLTHSAPMVARRPKVAQPQPPRMSVDEQRLARMWHAEDGLGPYGDWRAVASQCGVYLTVVGRGSRPEQRRGPAAQAHRFVDVHILTRRSMGTAAPHLARVSAWSARP